MLIEILVGGVLGILGTVVDALPEVAITWPDLHAFTSILWAVNDILPVDLVFDLAVIVIECIVVIYGFRALMWAKGHLPFIGGNG